ncbi:hypothetical protein J6W20_03420 [bacterium]|nr:hypothetical protein [bacterium]
MTNSQKDSYDKTLHDLKQLLSKLEGKVANSKEYLYLCAKLAQIHHRLHLTNQNGDSELNLLDVPDSQLDDYFETLYPDK